MSGPSTAGAPIGERNRAFTHCCCRSAACSGVGIRFVDLSTAFGTPPLEAIDRPSSPAAVSPQALVA